MTVSAFLEERVDVVTGPIVMWHGPLANIPDGWALCDGNNGTPDLRGRFIKGTPTAGTNPGSTGGQDSFSMSTSQLPSHTHTGSVDAVGTHNHAFGQGSNGKVSGSGRASFAGSGRVYNTSSVGNHQHDLTVGTAGSSASIDNLPSYYEVAYLMKL